MDGELALPWTTFGGGHLSVGFEELFSCLFAVGLTDSKEGSLHNTLLIIPLGDLRPSIASSTFR